MPDGYRLFLIRHGLAAERGPAYPDDDQRPLTSRGIARLRQEARALVHLGISFDRILTSPLVRTRETAEILSEGLPGHPVVVDVPALAPGSSVTQVINEVAKHAKGARLALVGHEPGIGELAAALVGARVAIEFKKGAICRVDCDTLPPADPGRLRWFLTPRQLRAIAR